MSKTSELAATPRLRFPAFRETGEWKSERMGQLYSFMPTNTYSRNKLNYDSGTVKNIHYGDIHTRFSTLFEVVRERVPFVNGSEVLPAPGSEAYCLEGDLVFADASEDLNDVGKSIEIVRLNGERLLAGQHTILARPNDDKLVAGFGGYLFRSGWMQSQIRKEAQGTKVYGISPTRLANVEVVYPTDVKEQRHIVDCLTSLDDVIAAQAQKVEALKAHKRGLMQRLLPREGETFPALRFTGFAGRQPWHVQRVSSLLQKVSTPVAVSPELSYREIGIRSHGKGIFHKEPVTGEAIGAKRVFKVVKNALVVNIVFAWEQAVATTSDAEDGMIASHRFPMFVARPGKCDVRYVKEFFLTKRGKHLLEVASPGGAGRNKTLGQTEFENLEIAVPVSVEEQSRIADFLALLDGRIAAESEKLAVLMTHKKSLMQQLFPSASAE